MISIGSERVKLEPNLKMTRGKYVREWCHINLHKKSGDTGSTTKILNTCNLVTSKTPF